MSSLRDLVLALNDLDNPLPRLRRLLKPLRDHYDLVFVDCAPGMSLVSDSVMRASDLVLVPTIPTTLSLRTYAQLLDHARAKGFDAPILPFFSMADRRRRLHRDVMLDFTNRSPECSRIVIPYGGTGRADGRPAVAGDPVRPGQYAGPRLRAALEPGRPPARGPGVTVSSTVAGRTLRRRGRARDPGLRRGAPRVGGDRADRGTHRSGAERGSAPCLRCGHRRHRRGPRDTRCLAPRVGPHRGIPCSTSATS